jgi:hypothetical protein
VPNSTRTDCDQTADGEVTQKWGYFLHLMAKAVESPPQMVL